MDAKKRARFALVVDMLSGAVKDNRTTVVPGSGPTLSEIVTAILAAEAVVTVKGDAAAAAAAAGAHITSGRADKIMKVVRAAKPREQHTYPAPVHCGGGLSIRADIDQIGLDIIIPGRSSTFPVRETIILSHTENRCILKEDCSDVLDEDRARLHLRIIAEEIHRRDDRSMTVEEMIEQLQERAPSGWSGEFIRFDVAGVDWNVTGLYRDQINHHSLDEWRKRVRTGINQSKLRMRPRAKQIEKAVALVGRLNAELVRQGRPPEAYYEQRNAAIYIGIPVLTERLTVSTGSYDIDYASIYHENQLKSGEEMHRKLTAMLQGHAPAKTPDEVVIGLWRFDPVLLRLVAMHSPDPEQALQRIIFGPSDSFYEGKTNPIGPGAPAFHTRVSKLEATIRVQIAEGIAWSNGSVTINTKAVAIPEQLIGAMTGRRLGEIVSHPLLDADAEIVNASLATGRKGNGTVTLQTRRALLPAYDIIRPMPLAA